MTDTTRNRLAIDLDEIERQLVQPAPVAGRQDPLAELARIVGQDDPFRAILADRPAPVAAERRASFDDYLDHAQASSRAAQVPPQRLTAEEEHLLGLTPQAQTHEAHGYASDQMQYEPAPEMPAYAADKPRRRGIILAGSVMGVALVGLTTAFVMKGSGGSGPKGEVPVVRADAGPTKIQPQNPGGMEIPDQNKRIYDKGSPEGQTRVVARDEQPVDVRQTVRANQAQDGGQPATTGAAAALGEPRRVRTVVIRPDAPAAGSGSDLPAPPPAPRAAPAVPPSVAMPMPAPQPARPPVASTSQTVPPAAAPESQKAPQRVASIGSPPVSEPRAAPEAATGGFAVQLGVRGSEQQARAAFQQLQQKFGDELGRQSPLIRKAEVNGATIYRVRVGPMSKDEANTLCSKLSAGGGQCFVAKN